VVYIILQLVNDSGLLLYCMISNRNSVITYDYFLRKINFVFFSDNHMQYNNFIIMLSMIQIREVFRMHIHP